MVPDRYTPDRRQLAVGLALLGVLLAGGVSTTVAQSDSVSLVTMNDTVRVHAVENATVYGTSDLEAGTTVTVRVQSAGDTQPRLFENRDVTVAEDGSFSVALDLSSYEPGDRFKLTVLHDNSTVAEGTMKVVGSSVRTTPTPTPSPTSTTGPGFGLLAAVVGLGLFAARALRS